MNVKYRMNKKFALLLCLVASSLYAYPTDRELSLIALRCSILSARMGDTAESKRLHLIALASNNKYTSSLSDRDRQEYIKFGLDPASFLFGAAVAVVNESVDQDLLKTTTEERNYANLLFKNENCRLM